MIAKLEDVIGLERSSAIDSISLYDYIADREDISVNVRKSILKSRIDGRYFYREMKDGKTVKAFEMLLSWTPFPDVFIFSFTPDGLHICTMDSRCPGEIEYGRLKPEQVVPGMSFQYNGITFRYEDENHVSINGKIITVENDSASVFRYLKQKIKADGGASGLFSVWEREILNNGPLLLYIRKAVEMYGCGG